MVNKEIHILDIEAGKTLKEKIEYYIYESNLPSYVVIAILENIKFQIQLAEYD